MNIALISLGCPKNQVDADVMCYNLIKSGYKTTPHLQEADFIIINTCGFIESAKQEAIDNILNACSYKEQSENVKVVVTGCLAERYRSEIIKEIPEVDAVIGIGSNKDICDILQKLAIKTPCESYGRKTDFVAGGKRVISTPSHYAYLKISEGCGNNCHYCAIPLIRGPLRSRTVLDIIQEANYLAQQGVKEIVLVAQDITAYGEDLGEVQIAKLLNELNGVNGIEWIRLLYAYPERITDEFVDAMAKNEKVLHYLDMPVQHINDDVLKTMNRKSTKQSICHAIEKLRSVMPDIVLRTTLITGYPTESEQSFNELCEFVKAYKFDKLGCFAYSEEEGTYAAELKQLPKALRAKRADIIMNIQADISAQKNEEKVGKTLKVICDNYDDERDLYECRSYCDAPEIDGLVLVKGEEGLAVGDMLDVVIKNSDVYDLYAF